MAHEISEELKKCAFCKKAVNPAKRYYRNSRYYCNVNCWNKSKEAAKSEKESE